MTRMSRDINGITAWIKEAGVTVDYGNISIDRPIGDISVMDSCVVDGVACLHNTAISVKPVQKL